MKRVNHGGAQKQQDEEIRALLVIWADDPEAATVNYQERDGV